MDNEITIPEGAKQYRHYWRWTEIADDEGNTLRTLARSNCGMFLNDVPVYVELEVCPACVAIEESFKKGVSLK